MRMLEKYKQAPVKAQVTETCLDPQRSKMDKVELRSLPRSQ